MPVCLSGYYLIILIKILLFGDENVTGLHGNFIWMAFY